jgi:hypothetical protein
MRIVLHHAIRENWMLGAFRSIYTRIPVSSSYCASDLRMGYEPSRTRTCDPLVKSQLLYRLSYRPTINRFGLRGHRFYRTPSAKSKAQCPNKI